MNASWEHRTSNQPCAGGTSMFDVRRSMFDVLRKINPGIQAFILLEAMIAVAVFSIGVLALGRCVENCIKAEMVKVEDERARRFLSNRMAEIEQGSVVVTDKATEDLKGEFEGVSLRTTRVPLKKKNEDEKELFGLFSITLELAWKNKGQALSRELNFYVYPRQQQ